jgi:hypothetical protein
MPLAPFTLPLTFPVMGVGVAALLFLNVSGAPSALPLALPGN